jgi:hypothetical protein
MARRFERGMDGLDGGLSVRRIGRYEHTPAASASVAARACEAAFGCEAVVRSGTAVCQGESACRVYDCCAAERSLRQLLQGTL